VLGGASGPVSVRAERHLERINNHAPLRPKRFAPPNLQLSFSKKRSPNPRDLQQQRPAFSASPSAVRSELVHMARPITLERGVRGQHTARSWYVRNEQLAVV